MPNKKINIEYHLWEWEGERLRLYPERYLYWENEHILLLSDVHIGKTTEWLHEGIYIPLSGIMSTIERIHHIYLRHPNSHLVIVGDLVHGKENQEWHELDKVLRCFPKVSLIEGNHDRSFSIWPGHTDIQIVERMEFTNIVLTHEPTNNLKKNQINIHGHIHPNVSLKGKGLQRLILPCFYKKEQQFCLPAFTIWSGKYVVPMRPEDTIWVITQNKVLHLSS